MNGKMKIFAIATLTLLLLSLTPNYIAGKQSQDPMEPPGVPDDAWRSNRTDTTPSGVMDQVMANAMYVFAYRNVTLVLNCTRNMELNMTIDPEVTPQYFWLYVEPNHAMNMTMNMNASAPQGAMTMERSINFYANMETNATEPLKAQLRLYINGTKLNAELNREVNCSRLMWHYWNETRMGWDPIESYIDEKGYLTCNTTHFSTWTVAETMLLQVTGSLSKTQPIIEETVTITTALEDETGSPITGATVKATVSSIVLDMSDQGNGNYQATLNTANLGEGTFSITITAEKEGYISGQDTLSLQIQPKPIDWILYGTIATLAVVAIIALIILRRK